MNALSSPNVYASETYWKPAVTQKNCQDEDLRLQNASSRTWQRQSSKSKIIGEVPYSPSTCSGERNLMGIV